METYTDEELKELDRKTGEKWRNNSSLEEWFPFTAEELQRLRAENEALKRDAEWISVDDRLPRNDIRVLVLRDAGQVINTSHPGHGDGRWVEVSTLMLGSVFLCDMSSTGTTTHWRPLPPPPDLAMKG